MATVATIEIVLLHGFAATSFTWRNVVGVLAEHGRVVALEREWDPPGVALEKTIAAIREQGCVDPVLIGHSAGADLAVRIAASGELAVRAIVLVAPVVGGGPPPAVRWLARLPVSAALAPPVLRLGARVAFERALRSAYVDRSAVDSSVVEGYRRPLLEPGVMEAMWAMSGESPSPVDVKAVECPCLAIYGDSDRWATHELPTQAHAVTYPGCGHLPHEEQADRFVADVVRFLAGLPPVPERSR